MRRCAIFFAVVSLWLPVTAFSQTRTPEAAVNHFQNAMKKGDRGDLDGAIEEYTKSLPAGTLLETGGTVEKSEQSNAALVALARAARPRWEIASFSASDSSAGR